MNTAMAPEDFTMWLRGVLDSVGEGKPIPAEVAQTLYAKLSEVVAGQVANRLLAADQPPSQFEQMKLALEQAKIQHEYEIARRKLEMEREWAKPLPVTYGTGTGTYGALKAVR